MRASCVVTPSLHCARLTPGAPLQRGPTPGLRRRAPAPSAWDSPRGRRSLSEGLRSYRCTRADTKRQLACRTAPRRTRLRNRPIPRRRHVTPLAPTTPISRHHSRHHHSLQRASSLTPTSVSSRRRHSLRPRLGPDHLQPLPLPSPLSRRRALASLHTSSPPRTSTTIRSRRRTTSCRARFNPLHRRWTGAGAAARRPREYRWGDARRVRRVGVRMAVITAEEATGGSRNVRRRRS